LSPFLELWVYGLGFKGVETDPGRTILSQAIASFDRKLWFFIMCKAMSVPVRPSPARQCTAMRPVSRSHMSRNWWKDLGFRIEGYRVGVRDETSLPVAHVEQAKVAMVWGSGFRGLGFGANLLDDLGGFRV
jgi:hypothetical protein